MSDPTVNIRLTAKDDASPTLRGVFSEMAGGVTVGNLLSEAISSIAKSFVGFAKSSIESSMSLDRLKTTIPIIALNTGRTTEEVNQLVLAIRSENKSMAEALEITRAVTLAGFKQAEALSMMNAARNIGAAVGRSSSEVNKLLIESIVNLNTHQLKTVGIILNQNILFRDYAQAHKIVSTELDTETKRQIIYNAVIEEGAKFQGAYNAAMGTAQKVLGSAKDAFEDVKSVLGDMLDDALFPIATVLLDDIRSFRAWAFTSENDLRPELKDLAATIGGVLFGAFMVIHAAAEGTINLFVMLGKTIGQIINFLVPASIEIKTAGKEMTQGMEDATAGMKKAEKSAKDIQQVIEDLGKKAQEIKQKWIDFGNAVNEKINWAKEAAINFYQKIVEWEPIKILLDSVKEKFYLIWVTLRESLWPAVVDLYNAWKPYMPLLKTLAEFLGIVLFGALTFVLNLFLGLVVAVTELTAIFTDYFAKALEIQTSLWKGLGDKISWTVDKMREAYDWAKKLAVQGIGQSFANLGANLAQTFIPGRAAGGPVTAGSPYIVGERGPELFIPGTSGQIAAGVGGVSIIMQSPVFLDDLAAEKFTDILMRRLKAELKL